MDAPPAPDPAQGIFETLLVLEGAPVEPEAHLARLAASLRSIYGATPPAGVGEELARRARGIELGRLRLTVRPEPAAAGGARAEPAMELEAGRIDPADHFPAWPAALRSHQIPGGLGAHKWADRSTLPSLPRGGESLLHDGDEVLEAGRANVFALLEGVLVTPPLDGRILPGVTRAAAIAVARAAGLKVRERPLSLTELRAADAVLLTNSLRGIELAASLDSTPLAGRRDEMPPIWRQIGPSAPATAAAPGVAGLVAGLRARWGRRRAAAA